MRTRYALLLALSLSVACSSQSTVPDATTDVAPVDIVETQYGVDSAEADLVMPADLQDARTPPDLLPDSAPIDAAQDTAVPDLMDIAPDVVTPDLTDATPNDAVDLFEPPDMTEADADLETPDIPAPQPFAELWPLGEVQEECEGGLLASLDSPSGPIHILVLRGSHYQMGRQAGCLVGAQTGQFMANFLSYYTEAIQEEAAKMGLAPEQTSTLLISMLNNIWLHMEPYVDKRFTDEFAGFSEVALAQPEIAQFWTDTQPEWALRAFVLLSNLSDLNWEGTMEVLLQKLETGSSEDLDAFYAGDEMANLFRQTLAHGDHPNWPLKTSCSFFAAWGHRTENGHLLASRNLDWSTDTGISQMKGLTFFAPDDGTVHASIGYLGFIGALAGISQSGIVLSEVGSQSVMERLTGQPWTLKFREVLEDAGNLDDAVALLAGTTEDGKTRPPTIGYNWMAGYGDPDGAGANAAAATVENNGVVAGVLRGTPQCGQESLVVQFAQDGTPLDVVVHDADPLLANLESEALEIDSDGQPRLFTVDDEGAIILDNNGCPAQLSPDDTGKPFAVGQPLDCALFRGDEALSHAVRRWQTASNGPQGGGGNKLLCTSGSYRHRYRVMRDMLKAYEEGGEYVHNDQVVIEAGESKVPLQLIHAEQIARAAAMGSNVMSIAYDATALTVRFSYEIGTGETWEAAHKHGYYEMALAPAFDLLATTPLEKEE